MFRFLLIVLLCVVLWWVLKSLWRGYSFYRRMRDLYSGMPGGGDPFAGERRSGATGQSRGARPRRKKGRIIPPEYAEDVEFVETKSYSEEHVSSDGNKTTYTERQVTDVEWEDIK